MGDRKGLQAFILISLTLSNFLVECMQFSMSD